MLVKALKEFEQFPGRESIAARLAESMNQDNIEAELKRAKQQRMRGYSNGGYSNAGDNGNFDIDKWNTEIKHDR